MESQILKPKSGTNGSEFDYRFRGIANCSTLVAVPIGATLIWEILLFLFSKLHLYDFDLLSIPAFPKRIINGHNTALSAIDIAVIRHRVGKVIVFQTSDYHYLRTGSLAEKIRDDAYHKLSLIECGRELKLRHKKVETVLIYVRMTESDRAIFSVIEDSGAENVVFEIDFNVLLGCDGIVITCIDFRF